MVLKFCLKRYVWNIFSGYFVLVTTPIRCILILTSLIRNKLVGGVRLR